ncbi:MAG: F0F1 ATP synthase subunit epsilon [Chloroflexi bacterium]|nr:F0F1 ATP synthase subunit epsilon [Chloroflexota bacterium]
MPKLSLDIVTIERAVYSADDVDMVTAPGIEGEMGILPRHAPILTALKEGELRIKRGDQEEPFAIGGGYIEVRPDRVIVLADSAEHVDEIDLERAEAARERAEKMLREGAPPEGVSRAALESALRRSRVRLKIARRRRRRRPPGGAMPGISTEEQ